MQINVAQLLKEPVGATREYGLDELNVHLVYVNPSARVRGQVQLTRIPRGILVRARLTTTAQVNCVRCLASVEERLDLQLEEEYFPTIDIWSGRPVEPFEGVDADAQTIDENHVLDLTDAVRQSAQVAMALNPLCRPDCRGLCPWCGANRNDVDCGHGAELAASPFAALRGLDVNS